MSEPIYVVRELDTAEDLFDALSPVRGELWERSGATDGAEQWFFRGQSNAADGTIWKLTPTAFRPGTFLRYRLHEIADVPPTTGDAQRSRELSAVMGFANGVDRQGLIIPGDSHELRDNRLEQPSINFREFPPARLMAMFALAQHHGVPTRVLDWSWKSLVAVYFAVEAVARRRGPGKRPSDDAPFSIFALRRAVFNAAAALDPGIIQVHVPSATNANLHAQGGLFTLIQPVARDEFPVPDLASVLERLAPRIATRLDGAFAHLFPFLIEFRVPAREARTALMLLERMGVTAASIFPGLSGVARSLDEPRFYEWNPPGSRA